jgi:hypothetical protein
MRRKAQSPWLESRFPLAGIALAMSDGDDRDGFQVLNVISGNAQDILDNLKKAPKY